MEEGEEVFGDWLAGDCGRRDPQGQDLRQIFIRAEKSASLKKIKQELQEKWSRLEAIYASAGSTIAPRFAKLMNQPPKDDGSWEEEDDDEDDEGAEPEQMESTDVEDATSL